MRFFDRFVEKTRVKVHARVENMAIGDSGLRGHPFPRDRGVDRALGAWILEMDKKKASLAIVGCHRGRDRRHASRRLLGSWGQVDIL